MRLAVRITQHAEMPAAVVHYVRRCVPGLWLGIVHAAPAELLASAPRRQRLSVHFVDPFAMMVMPRASVEGSHAAVRPPRHRAFPDPASLTDVLAFPDPLFTSTLWGAGANGEPIFSDGSGRRDVAAAAFERELREQSSPGAGAGAHGAAGWEDCGDVVVCYEAMERALGPDRRRCNEVGTRAQYLLAALAHALLHVFGFRHDTAAQYEAMVAMERRLARFVMDRRHIERGL